MIKAGDIIKVDGIDCTVYKTDGTAYYALENSNHEYNGTVNLEWGAYNVLIGTETTDGSGLSNSNKILANSNAFIPNISSNSTIWTALKSLRESTGNENWYVYSRDEMKEYDLYSGAWTSSESTATNVYIHTSTSLRKSSTNGVRFSVKVLVSEIDSKVEITQEDGADIRYTDDGTDPDETDTLYESPISASNGDIIKARAYLNENTFPSDITSVTIDTSFLPKTETIPLGTELEDGYIIYDRGENLGDYNLLNGKLTRLSAGVDDGSYNSENWRFLICSKQDLPGNDEDENNKIFGYILAALTQNLGYGFDNTVKMENLLSRYSDFIWYQVKIWREQYGEKWFVPSFGEVQTNIISYIPNLKAGARYFTSSTSGNTIFTFSPTGNNPAVTPTDTLTRVRMFCRI